MLVLSVVANLQICFKIHSSRLMMNIYKTLLLNLIFYVFLWLHVYGVIKEYFKYIPSYLLRPFRDLYIPI